MNDNKSRDIFYGVIAVATLIVALVGATLAYFSISASSEEGAVNAKAAVVNIEYNDGDQVTAQADKLIPASLDVVKNVYEHNSVYLGTETALRNNICIDANQRQVCSIYRFSIRSDVERNITATLNSEKNEFSHLSYAVRDVTNNSWLNLSPSAGTIESISLVSCSNENEDETDDCYQTVSTVKTYNSSRAIKSLFGYTDGNTFAYQTVGTIERIYDIVIFLEETGENQNEEQGKEYQGTIVVETTDNAIITGQRIE